MNKRLEIMKVREVIPHICPIPIVIHLKSFLDLLRDPVVSSSLRLHGKISARLAESPALRCRNPG